MAHAGLNKCSENLIIQASVMNANHTDSKSNKLILNCNYKQKGFILNLEKNRTKN